MHRRAKIVENPKYFFCSKRSYTRTHRKKLKAKILHLAITRIIYARKQWEILHLFYLFVCRKSDSFFFWFFPFLCSIIYSGISVLYFASSRSFHIAGRIVSSQFFFFWLFAYSSVLYFLKETLLFWSFTWMEWQRARQTNTHTQTHISLAQKQLFTLRFVFIVITLGLSVWECQCMMYVCKNARQLGDKNCTYGCCAAIYRTLRFICFFSSHDEKTLLISFFTHAYSGVQCVEGAFLNSKNKIKKKQNERNKTENVQIVAKYFQMLMFFFCHCLFE